MDHLQLDHLIIQGKVPMVLPTMLTINRYKIPPHQLDKFLQLDMLNRLHHLYMPIDIINHPDTWHLQHKYS